KERLLGRGHQWGIAECPRRWQPERVAAIKEQTWAATFPRSMPTQCAVRAQFERKRLCDSFALQRGCYLTVIFATRAGYTRNPPSTWRRSGAFRPGHL